ncbi:Transmembrane component CbiQ of energizing module of cobalt ECF transporter [Lachnospiraceae bacterium TWA4]|nr:Transmembrane component CbiQ of energizing module of cobalt ECF transporter [Lachnospiraceae bacterium TWA4]
MAEHEHNHEHGHDHEHEQKHKHGFGHKHNTGSLSIDYLAYNSRIRPWNPGFKVAFSFFMLVYCIVMNNIAVSAIVILSMMFITVKLGGLDLHEYISLLTIPIFFAVFSGLAIALNFSSSPAGDYCLNLGAFCIYATNASLLKTARIILNAFGAISCMYMMSLSTPVNEIICVLQDIHLPTLFTELMNMIYRFIFILLDVQSRMTISARSRLGYIDLKTSWYSFGSVLSNLLIVAMKKSNAYFDALVSRGYDGRLQFLTEEKPLDKKLVVYAIIYVGILSLIWYFTKQYGL